MRSRYSAYALRHYDYLQQTYSPGLQNQHPVSSLAEFGDVVQFVGLSIVQVQPTPPQVHFIARYLIGNKLERLEEQSEFEQINERWYYVSGRLIEHKAEKIDRNDSCPCGSGHKFKKCHG